MAISGNQWQSVAIISNQCHSEALRGNQARSRTCTSLERISRGPST